MCPWYNKNSFFFLYNGIFFCTDAANNGQKTSTKKAPSPMSRESLGFLATLESPKASMPLCPFCFYALTQFTGT